MPKATIDRTAPRLPATWAKPILPVSTEALKGGVPSRILPGPMEGITRGAFCRVMTRRGLVSCWITPFLRFADTAPRPGRLRRILRPYLESGVPVVTQLMGTHPGVLAAVARSCIESGAVGVDLNAACPSPTVVRRGAGGALLRTPERIQEILEALRAATAGTGATCSVKLRIGWESALEFEEIARAVRAAGPDFVVLHYRTVREMYRESEEALGRFAAARRLLPGTLLLASGDLYTVEDAARLARNAGVDGAAPARGILRDPPLLRRIEAACTGAAPPPEWGRAERLDFLAEIAEEALAAGARRRGFLIELARYLFDDDPAVLGPILRAPDPEGVIGACRAAGRRLAACRDHSSPANSASGKNSHSMSS